MPGANAAPRLCQLRWPTMSPVIARCALKGKVTPDSYLCMYVCIHLSIHTHINEVSRHNMIIVCVEDANGKRRGVPRRGMCGSRLVWVVGCGWHRVWPGQQGAQCRGCGRCLVRDEGSDQVLGRGSLESFLEGESEDSWSARVLHSWRQWIKNNEGLRSGHGAVL